MRLAFWRTEKPVARPVLQPGADRPDVPRLGVWMIPIKSTDPCHACLKTHVTYEVEVDGLDTELFKYHRCEGCGAKLVAQLRREREG